MLVRIYNRSLLFFVSDLPDLFFCSHFFVVMLLCTIVRIILSATCDGTTVWVAISSSMVGYNLHFTKHFNLSQSDNTYQLIEMNKNCILFAFEKT